MTHLKVIMFFALFLVGSGERLITGGFVLFGKLGYIIKILIIWNHMIGFESIHQ